MCTALTLLKITNNQAGAARRSEPTAAARVFIPWTPERVRWTAGLMLALLIAAMDSTIVGIALPTIGGELGNFSLYPWVFSGYLLTATCGMQISRHWSISVWGALITSDASYTMIAYHRGRSFALPSG